MQIVKFFLKLNESEVSPQWFAEENRVVPLVASPEVQRVIFEPVRIKPHEESDYVEFHCANPIPEAMLKCVRSGVIEVTNVRGESCRQVMTPGDVAGAVALYGRPGGAPASSHAAAGAPSGPRSAAPGGRAFGLGEPASD